MKLLIRKTAYQSILYYIFPLKYTKRKIFRFKTPRANTILHCRKEALYCVFGHIFSKRIMRLPEDQQSECTDIPRKVLKNV